MAVALFFDARKPVENETPHRINAASAGNNRSALSALRMEFFELITAANIMTGKRTVPEWPDIFAGILLSLKALKTRAAAKGMKITDADFAAASANEKSIFSGRYKNAATEKIRGASRFDITASITERVLSAPIKSAMTGELTAVGAAARRIIPVQFSIPHKPDKRIANGQKMSNANAG